MKRMKVVLCQLKIVMKVMVEVGKHLRFGYENRINNATKGTQLYMTGHKCFLYLTIRHKRRHSSINW